MELANEFIHYLFSYGSLDLPGLGRLYIRKIPARKAHYEMKIYGPDLLIEFKEDTSIEKTAGSRFIRRKFDINKNKAEKKIQKNSTFILNQLLNLGESRIDNFGKFYKDDEEKIKFETDPGLRKLIELQYPDLVIPFFEEKKDSTPEASERSYTNYGQGPEPEQKIGWFFPLLSLIATSLLLACLISCYFQKREGSDKGLKIIPFLKDSSAATNDVSTIDFPKETDPGTVTSPDSLTDDDVFDYEEDDWREESAFEEDTFYNDPAIDAADPLLINFDDIGNLSLDYLLQVSAQKRLAMESPCMVVVGSFLRRDLLNNMVNRLNGDGHNIYIEKYGNYYRTAIIYECYTKDQNEFLDSVRHSIEAKAWVLDW